MLLACYHHAPARAAQNQGLKPPPQPCEAGPVITLSLHTRKQKLREEVSQRAHVWQVAERGFQPCRPIAKLHRGPSPAASRDKGAEQRSSPSDPSLQTSILFILPGKVIPMALRTTVRSHWSDLFQLCAAEETPAPSLVRFLIKHSMAGKRF